MSPEQIFRIFLGIEFLVVFLMLYRVLKGPTVFDRLNGLAVLGTNTIVILLLYGFLEKRVNMFVDIAISYGILGFVTLVVLAKYFEGKEDIES
ncbi:MAG TPA: pH regulation protein F [Clostridia bacterium]|jgi:multicomponent Na+:H+ antiporter subunit F|nr:pH regulation protein F [Clostridia bacterium]